MKPWEVDALGVIDFLVHIDFIKARLDSREKAAEKGVALGI